MRNAANRIAELEAKVAVSAGIRRVYSVIGGPEGGNPADFVGSHGYDIDDRHDCIIHRVLMASSGEGPVFVERPWGWVGGVPARTPA